MADITNSLQLSVGEGLLKILMICGFVSGYLSYFLFLSLGECWKEVVSIITPQTIELIAFFIIVLENRVVQFSVGDRTDRRKSECFK